MVELFVLIKKKRPRGRFFFIYYAVIVQYKPNYAFWFYQIVRRFARLFLIVSTYGAISGQFPMSPPLRSNRELSRNRA